MAKKKTTKKTKATKSVKKSDQLRGKKKAMFDALCSSMGNITAATSNVGISRRTHYDWIRDDPVYAEALDEVEERQLDFYETALHGLIKDKNVTAVIFALKTKGKKRGYIEKQEIAHSGELKGHLDLRSVVMGAEQVARKLEEERRAELEEQAEKKVTDEKKK